MKKSSSLNWCKMWLIMSRLRLVQIYDVLNRGGKTYNAVFFCFLFCPFCKRINTRNKGTAGIYRALCYKIHKCKLYVIIKKKTTGISPRHIWTRRNAETFLKLLLFLIFVGTKSPGFPTKCCREISVQSKWRNEWRQPFRLGGRRGGGSQKNYHNILSFSVMSEVYKNSRNVVCLS